MRATRRGFTLLEVIVASGILAAVIGPIIYVMVVGTRSGMARHSAALLGCHIAAERIQNDLDQMAYPDGPDQSDGSRLPYFRISDPGPDEGSKITFWLPRPRGGASNNVPREIRVVPVSYYLERIPDTDTYWLIREVSGGEGAGKRRVGDVVLRRIWFHLLRNLEENADAEPQPGGGEMSPWGGGAMSADVLRVLITACDKPAKKEQMVVEGAAENSALPAAMRVTTFTLGFLKSVVEPSLVWRLRDPGAQKYFKFIETDGAFPASVGSSTPMDTSSGGGDTSSSGGGDTPSN